MTKDEIKEVVDELENNKVYISKHHTKKDLIKPLMGINLHKGKKIIPKKCIVTYLREECGGNGVPINYHKLTNTLNLLRKKVIMV